MDSHIKQIAQRIQVLRDISGIPAGDMASRLNMSIDEYAALESGQVDFSFTFLYKCANIFNVEIMELLTGDAPRLTGYAVTRRGEGLPIKRREGFSYENHGYLFRDKLAEPYIVTAQYREQEQNQPVMQTTHEHQEFDLVLSGQLKFVYGAHEEILSAGDSVYYDSRRGHGMIAVGGEDCVFLAVVIRQETQDGIGCSAKA